MLRPIRYFLCALLAALVLLIVCPLQGHAQADWVRSAGGTDSDFGVGVAVDDAGNTYVTGTFEGSADFDGDGTADVTGAGGSTDLFVAKYDAAGTLAWVLSAGGTGFDQSTGISVDGDGNVYVTGTFEGSADFNGNGAPDVTTAGGGDIFVAKYTAAGALAWVLGAGGSSSDEGGSIAVDDAGNAYVTGSFNLSADFDEDGTADVTTAGGGDIFVAKYDAAGALAWVKSAGGSMFDGGRGIAVDDAGNTYVTGNFRGSADFDGDGTDDVTSAGSGDIFVAKYDVTGALMRVQRAGGANSITSNGIAVDGSGDSYITGNFRGTADFDEDGSGDITSVDTQGGGDMFVAKYDAAGALAWARNAGSTSSDVGHGIAVDGAGDTYVTGDFNLSADFDGDGSADVTTAGSGDIFVAKYDAGGSLIDVDRAGGTNSDGGAGIAADDAGNTYVTGFFNDSADFDEDGTDDVTGPGGFGDIFVARYDASALPVELASFTGTTTGESIILNWATVSEENNAGFDVERSTNGTSFDKIGFENGFGTTAETQSYRFVDTEVPFADTLYYRLRQIDTDGSLTTRQK